MAEHRTVAAAPRQRGATDTRGVVYLHAVPRALAPHVEWALAAVLGQDVRLPWTAQPVAAGMLRAELAWTGRVGTAAEMASALRPWQRLLVEITEEPTAGHEGERYALTPTLGIFRAAIGPHGDVQVSEERLRAAMQRCESAASLRAELDGILGGPWDVELEPFRCAADGDPVRWLHRTG